MCYNVRVVSPSKVLCSFSFLFVSGSKFLGVFCPPFPEEEILDYLTQDPASQVPTILRLLGLVATM